MAASLSALGSVMTERKLEQDLCQIRCQRATRQQLGLGQVASRKVPPGKEVQERKLCFCFPFSPQTFLSFPFWVSGGDLNVRRFLCLCIVEEKSKPLQLFSRQSSAIKPIVTYKARFFYCRKMMDGPPPPGSQCSFMMRGSLDTTDHQTYPP